MCSCVNIFWERSLRTLNMGSVLLRAHDNIGQQRINTAAIITLSLNRSSDLLLCLSVSICRYILCLYNEIAWHLVHFQLKRWIFGICNFLLNLRDILIYVYITFRILSYIFFWHIMSNSSDPHDDYSDIIDLPRPTNSKYPRMPNAARAAQFAPFAALDGLGKSIEEAKSPLPRSNKFRGWQPWFPLSSWSHFPKMDLMIMWPILRSRPALLVGMPVLRANCCLAWVTPKALFHENDTPGIFMTDKFFCFWFYKGDY